MPENKKPRHPYDPDYCIVGTNGKPVFENLLNIEDPAKLSEAEKELTSLRMVQLQEKPIHGHFDLKHLMAIHKYIFQDVYDWAGELRTVDISKGLTRFCPSFNIVSYANESIFPNYLSSCMAAKNNKNEFVKMLARQYGELNILHPFREGNGRTQREFAKLVCLECGYNLSFQGIKRDEMIYASAKAFNEDYSYFETIFSKALSPIQEKLKEDNKDPFEPIESDVVR